MKFNCDRCKTRYSISDERVSGKVLKIRCKNCSAVITVREGMTASAPKTPRPGSRSGALPRPAAAAAAPAPARSGVGGGLAAASAQPDSRARSESALRGAFDDAMRAPSAADSMTGPPAALTTEWYTAIDGNQSGPFDLASAKGWIQRQLASAEIYCWSEGFDDWLPIEKVSQFRGARNGVNGSSRPGTLGGMASSKPMPTFDANVEKTPAPLFAATMEKVSAEAPTLMEDDDPMSPEYRAKGSSFDAQADAARDRDEGGGAFEFDIGEASRVVNLASLMPPGGLAAPAGQSAGLPGMAQPVSPSSNTSASALPTVRAPTSAGLSLPRAATLAPVAVTAPKKSRILLPLLIASVMLALVLGVLLFLAFRDQNDGEEDFARAGGAGGEDLAIRYDDGRENRTDVEKPINDTGKTNDTGKAATNTAGNTGTNGTRKGSGVTKTNGDKGGSAYVPPSDEVDLSGGPTSDPIKQGSLDPGDIVAVYRRAQFSINRCYERSIKSNPLLKVGKTNVNLKVSTAGKVTSVSVPSLAGKPLGSCLEVAIGRWRFPKSTEGFRGSFPIVFKR